MVEGSSGSELGESESMGPLPKLGLASLCGDCPVAQDVKKARSTPTFHSATPPIRLGFGMIPALHQRQTVAVEMENRAATTGKRTWAAVGKSSNDRIASTLQTAGGESPLRGAGFPRSATVLIVVICIEIREGLAGGGTNRRSSELGDANRLNSREAR